MLRMEKAEVSIVSSRKKLEDSLSTIHRYYSRSVQKTQGQKTFLCHIFVVSLRIRSKVSKTILQMTN